jgi:WD40 repeat protein
VLSILNRRCVECHGTAKQSGRLRLDTLEGMFRGGKSGPPIASGKSAESLLYQKVVPGAEKRMPPRGEPLAEADIEAIRAWIDAGARAAAAAAAREPVVELKPLPAGFRPLFALTGDPQSPRLAAARGSAVEVLAEPPGEEGKTPSLSRVLEGHADVVQSLAFSPDGTRLASGEFRVVRVWGTAEWDLRWTLGPHADRVLALAFSPDGKRLAAGGGLPSESGEVKLWDLETGRLLWSAAPHSDTVLALDFAPDGAAIFTGGADRVSYLLEAQGGTALRRLEGHTHHVLAVAMAPDGKRVATAGADRAVRLWDLEGGQPRTLRGHEGPVTSVRFAREGRALITTGGDAAVRFWNVGNASADGALGEARGYLQAGTVYAGGKRFASAEEEGTVRIYDVERKRLLHTLEPQARP